MSPFSLVAGLVPVLLFLIALVFMDSYKLVRRGAVLRTVGIGCGVAIVSLVANQFATDLLHVEATLLRRYLAPIAEETLKALAVFVLIRSGRVAFLVDAAILGFAVGTGFALVENVYYAGAIGPAGSLVWIIRGLGTAVMHGSATAIVAIVSKDLADRRGSKALVLFLPGLVLAIAAHSLFNHLIFNPLLSTAVLLTVMPLLVLFVYHHSEIATRHWLGAGLDHDVELLELISSGELADSRVGTYLESLRSRFEGPIVADMLCLLRIHLELSLRAKGIMIARAAGMEVPADPDVEANLRELGYLERSIGKTGRLALLPFLHTSDRDLWQIHMLGGTRA